MLHPHLQEVRQACDVIQYIHSDHARPIHEASDVLLAKLSAVLSSKRRDLRRISRALDEFLETLKRYTGPSYTIPWIRAATHGCLILSRGIEENPFLKEHATRLRAALEATVECEVYSSVPQAFGDVPAKMRRELHTLFHATTAVTNSPTAARGIASQDDVDFYFERSAYALLTRGCDFCRYSGQRRLHPVDWDDGGKTTPTESSFQFTNGLMNFLHAVSNHPNCSSVLRSMIRLEILSFLPAYWSTLQPFEAKFDLQGRDLRVSGAAIDELIEHGYEGWYGSMKNSKQFCLDAPEEASHNAHR